MTRRNDAHGEDARGFFHPRTYWFNPYLLQWLNDRDYCSGDWPFDIPDDLRKLADQEVGHGIFLGADGWPVLPVAATPLNFDPIYLGA